MEVKKIAVVGGGGQMGRGIAQVAALGGYKVTMIDRSMEILEKGRSLLEASVKKGVDRGKIAPEKAAAVPDNLSLAAEFEAAADVDLVIEAVNEDLALKCDVFRKFDEICPPHTVLASNTSSLSITEIFAPTKRVDRTIGMHFFIPVEIMRLVEIIRGLETSDETVKTIEEVSARMGKETVLVNEAPGFATSRINALIGNEAFRMLQEGVASAQDIDKAIKLGLNHPMGPFEMIDMVGLDTRLHILEYLAKTLGDRFMPNPLHVKYVKAGRLGRKTGKGVYEYPPKDGK